MDNEITAMNIAKILGPIIGIGGAIAMFYLFTRPKPEYITEFIVK